MFESSTSAVMSKPSLFSQIESIKLAQFCIAPNPGSLFSFLSPKWAEGGGGADFREMPPKKSIFLNSPFITRKN